MPTAGPDIRPTLGYKTNYWECGSGFISAAVVEPEPHEHGDTRRALNKGLGRRLHW